MLQTRRKKGVKKWTEKIRRKKVALTNVLFKEFGQNKDIQSYDRHFKQQVLLEVFSLLQDYYYEMCLGARSKQ